MDEPMRQQRLRHLQCVLQIIFGKLGSMSSNGCNGHIEQSMTIHNERLEIVFLQLDVVLALAGSLAVQTLRNLGAPLLLVQRCHIA